MSLRKLPEIRADHRMSAAQFDVRPEALECWEPAVRASAAESETSISMYGRIGETWDGEGVTSKRISAALRNIGAREVTVNVNSPGGDYFEGIAIYNLLRMHPAKVSVRVMSLAASVASVIAMAGDEVWMGEGSRLMVHNAWAIAMGNRHDLRDAADWLEPLDEAMAEVYASRTGKPVAEMAALMDKETWIPAKRALEDGFATGLLSRSDILQDTQAHGHHKALAMVEASMARAGHSRSVRRDALKALFSGTPGAAEDDAMPGAGDAAALLLSLTQSLKV